MQAGGSPLIEPQKGGSVRAARRRERSGRLPNSTRPEFYTLIGRHLCPGNEDSLRAAELAISCRHIAIGFKIAARWRARVPGLVLRIARPRRHIMRRTTS